VVQHGWPGGQPSIYEHRGFIAGAGCHQRAPWQLWTAGSPSTHNVAFMEGRSPGRPCYINLTVHIHGCSTWNTRKYPRWFNTAGREASPPYTNTGVLLPGRGAINAQCGIYGGPVSWPAVLYRQIDHAYSRMFHVEKMQTPKVLQHGWPLGEGALTHPHLPKRRLVK
jgi:hypothetical protein